MPGWLWVGVAVVVILATVAGYDLAQRQHAILRNFPLIGHLRYLLESVGPGAAPVHRHRQPPGAPVRPRPAALDLHLGQGSQQQLRVRLRHRSRDDARSRHRRPEHVPAAAPGPRRRSGAVREGARPGAGSAGDVPTRLCRQRVRHELRGPERGGRRSDQSWLRTGRLPPQHRGRRRFALPPDGGRAGLAGRHRLFRVP